ncbi:sugar-binding transcriptional regulator [Nocardioides sp.]|uniref:sugar-binding transcriptional regulator n=1 Tax=Nocardioides sp. TaxID=35761 RepID=UPI0039E35EC0
MAATTPAPRPSDPDLVRLMVAAARLYHVHGLRQRDIGARLGISQARVSRVLQQAERQGLVTTVIAVPDGLDPELEEELERRYDLAEVHVVDLDPAVVDPAAGLGRAAARYLGEAGLSAEIVGYTSWSRTLQEMAGVVRFAGRPTTRYVVEMIGDLGSPLLQHAAARSTRAMARALGADAVFLRTPGVTSTPEIRAAVLADPHVRRALGLLDQVDVAFVGVGPAAVHSGLEPGESYFTDDQLAQARADGAVGQLDQRFLDASGAAVLTPLDDLVVGCTLANIGRARRRIVVAGGVEKHRPIEAALRGGWVDVLVTDRVTAAYLATAPPPQGPPQSPPQSPAP